jgi:GAF domain-containing protein
VATVVAVSSAVHAVAAAADSSAMADRIVDAGRSLVPGTSGCALAVRRARDRLEIGAASSADARLVTDLQRSLREGPVLDAMRSGEPVRTTSLGEDPRWPRLAAHQAELGISSVLAVPLIGARGPFGTLVCYAAQTAAFGSDAEALAAALAGQAALVYAARELEANLRAGMETRERIGQAVGVLMERHRLTSQQAFDLLVYVSQRTHRKLRDIANWVTDTGEDPQIFLKHAERSDQHRV